MIFYLGLIEHSKEVGAATLDVLKQQREQIADINVEVTALDTNLKKAEKLIIGFTRRMATDKLIRILTLFNIMVLIAIIVYVIYTKKGLSSVSTSKAANLGPGNTYDNPTSSPTVFPTSKKSFFR
jgi:hypothetical protein